MPRAKNTPPRQRFTNPQDQVRAGLKNRPDFQMAHWAHEAKRLAESGKTAEARAALRKADRWRKKAGL
jgi:hypothetical protein